MFQLENPVFRPPSIQQLIFFQSPVPESRPLIVVNTNNDPNPSLTNSKTSPKNADLFLEAFSRTRFWRSHASRLVQTDVGESRNDAVMTGCTQEDEEVSASSWKQKKKRGRVRTLLDQPNQDEKEREIIAR